MRVPQRSGPVGVIRPGADPIARVRPTLHVGLAGDIPAGQQASFGAALSVVLATAAGAALDADRAGTELLSGPAVLRLVCAVSADLGDTVADVARASGWEVCSLGGLPRPGSAAAGPTFAIAEDGPGDPGMGLALGTILIDQSDVLILASGEDRQSGLVDGAWLQHEARSAGLLAIGLKGDAPDPVVLGGTGGWQAALEATVERALLPGHDSPTEAERLKVVAEARSFLRDAVPSGLVRAVYRAYENLLLLGSRPPRAAIAPPPTGWSPERGDPSTLPIETMRSLIATRLDHADRIAGVYADRYRVAAVLRITLGLVAMLGVFLAFYYANVAKNLFEVVARPDATFRVVETLGYAIDVAATLAILGMAYFADRRDWHKRFIAARYVAEHLRHVPVMAAVGGSVTRLQSASRQATGSTDWPSWYIRSVIRSVGLPDARVTPAYLASVRGCLQDLLAEQIQFYVARAWKFDTIAHRLWRLANGCYWMGLVALVARLLVFVCCDGDQRLQLAASLGCFFFPALAPIFIGLRSQGEYPKLAQRYTAMADTLRKTALDLGRADNQFPEVADGARRVTGLMLDEVAEWQTLIRSHSISRL